MTPIAGALFEACAEQRLAHVSASSDAAAALQTANALLQQVIFLLPPAINLKLNNACGTYIHKVPAAASIDKMRALQHKLGGKKRIGKALVGIPTSVVVLCNRLSHTQ